MCIRNLLHRLAAATTAAASVTSVCLVVPSIDFGGKNTPFAETAEAAIVATKNPPFHNYLTVDVQTDAKFDAVRTSVRHIATTNWSGRPVMLDTAHTPVLLAAYWCPHCQRTLKLLQSHQDEIRHMPRIVATGYVQGTTLKEAKALFLQEEKGLHLHVPLSDIDFLLNYNEAASIIEMFPQLYFVEGHQPETLMGEHTWKVWDRVFR